MPSNKRITTPQIYKFSKKLWNFTSKNLTESICEILQKDLEIDERMCKGLENLEENLKIYLELLNLSIENFSLTIFGSAIIENGAIIHATNKYHNKPWFSNVAIVMNSEELFDYTTDKGMCYGQVMIYDYLKIINIILINILLGSINFTTLRYTSKEFIKIGINTMV